MGPWVCGLHGSNFYVGCVGYAGQNVFYVGLNLLPDSIFLRGSKFLRGSFLGGGWVSKKS